MKASHRKIRHDRRVKHQRQQRQVKLNAITDSINAINESGYEVTKKHMCVAMQSRGYIFVDKIKKKDYSGYLTFPRNWKRMEKEATKPKPKASPTRKQQRKVVPGS